MKLLRWFLAYLVIALPVFTLGLLWDRLGVAARVVIFGTSMIAAIVVEFSPRRHKNPLYNAGLDLNAICGDTWNGHVCTLARGHGGAHGWEPWREKGRRP